MMRGPGFWMDETTGVLRPVVEAYLNGKDLTAEQVVIMRAYLRQWICAPVWEGAGALDSLRSSIDTINTASDIHRWLDEAEDLGIDPL